MLEGHFALVSFYTKRKNEAWEKLLRQDKKTYVAVEGTEIPTLSPTLHTLYVFLHLYHHLLELGIGLRQFCDWAVMLHDCKENIDQEQLRQHLGMLGMLKAYRACGSILTEYLGFRPNTDDYTPGSSFNLRDGRFVPLATDDCLPAADSAYIPQLMRMRYATAERIHFSRDQRARILDCIIRYYGLHIPAFPQLKSPAVLAALFD